MLDAAIVAHVQWRMRLQHAIDSGEPLEREAACSDRACELGQWMYGVGQIYANIEAFRELHDAHVHFHAEAGRIVDLIKSGNLDEARKELAHGNFSRHSVEMVSCLMRMDGLMK